MTANNYLQAGPYKHILKALLLLIFAAGTHTVSAQNIKLDARTQTREVAIDQIKAQTEYKVLFDVRSFDKNVRVNFGRTELPLRDVLAKLTEGTGLTYSIDDKLVIIYKREGGDSASQVAVLTERNIAGTVTDGNAPLEGVTVELFGKREKSATTFANGRFQIEDITPGTHILRLTSADGNTVKFREVRVTSSADADVTLQLTGDTLTTLPLEKTVAATEDAGRRTMAYFIPNDPVNHTVKASSDEARIDHSTIPTAHINSKNYLPKAAFKTNLLYDATGTLNIGVEIGLARKWTLDVAVGYNPFIFEKGGVNRISFVQPELRYWFCQRFEKHFIGLHGLYGRFNVGEVSFLTRTFEHHRYKGWGAGVGISYGYHLPIAKRWAMEFTVGAGYVWLRYDKFRCWECDEFVAKKGRHYLGPTKAGITLIFMIK